MIIWLCSPYTLIPHSFQENWHDHKKIRFHQIPPHCSGGMIPWKLLCSSQIWLVPLCASSQNSNQTLKLLIKRGLGVIWFLDHLGCRVFSIGLVYACLCFLTGISFSLHHFGEMLWLESTSMKGPVNIFRETPIRKL